MNRRVAVTGMGMITPLRDTKQTWEGVKAGKSAVAPLPPEFALCPTQIGGTIGNVNLDQWFSPALAKRIQKRSTKPSQLAQVAVKQALEQAGLLGEDGTLPQGLRTRAGVSLGTGVGSSELIEKMALDMERVRQAEGQEAEKQMQQLVSRHLATAMIVLPDASAFQTSLTFKLQGPMDCSIKACATGAGNIRRAAMEILLGHADIMVAGGTESLAPIDVMPFNVYAKSGALSRRNHDPEGASRPFDEGHDGFVPSEGAGVIVLEELEHARRRGAPILAELVGYGETSDAEGSTDPEQESQERAMNMALDMADPDPDEAWLVKTHGTSTVAGDQSEAKAISNIVEPVPDAFVWAPKSVLGHTLGASGGIEAGLAIQALRQGFIPPTLNLASPIPEAVKLHIPTQAVQADIRYALCNSFGFGGQNVCLVFAKWQG